MTETNPGDLQDTTDHPTLTGPGSSDKYFASIIEKDIAKQGLAPKDFVFVIMGISHDENGLAPCFLKEEKFDENSIKTYSGDIEGFVKRLSSYRSVIENSEGRDRKLIGVYHTAKKVERPEDYSYMEWNEQRMGPRRFEGFI